MQYKHNKQLVPLAKQLRKEMTKENAIFGMIICERTLYAFPDKRSLKNILLTFTVRKQNW